MGKFCFHYYEYGGGGMGDAVTCTKCDYSYYPSNDTLNTLILFGRIKNPPHKLDVLRFTEALFIPSILICILTVLIIIFKKRCI